MAVPTRSNNGGLPNPRARLSVLAGLGALAVPPLAIVAARAFSQVSLLQAAAAMPASALLGLAAILLARRARRQRERTLGRVGGAGLARAGHALGVLGVCLGITAALALGFYGLLSVFAA